jgi:hypothetical protein
VQKNASPVQAAEEPPNLKNPNKCRRKLGCIALDLAGFTIKIVVLGLLIVFESQTEKPLIKCEFGVRITRFEICPKVPNHFAIASMLDRSAKASLKISLS